MLEPASRCFFSPLCLNASPNLEEGSLICITWPPGLPPSQVPQAPSRSASGLLSTDAVRLPSGPGAPRSQLSAQLLALGLGKTGLWACLLETPMSDNQAVSPQCYLAHPNHSRTLGTAGELVWKVQSESFPRNSLPCWMEVSGKVF